MMHCLMITLFMLILFSQRFSLNHHKVLVKHLGWPMEWTMLGYWDYRGSQTSGAISKSLLPGWRPPERDNVIFSWVECLFWMSSNAGASPKLSVAFSTDGEPGQRRFHWTRKTQRKAGSSSGVHPRTNLGERPLTGAACGQFKNGADIVGLSFFGCNISHSLTETLEDGDVVQLFMFQRRPVESACPNPKARDFPAICGLDLKAANHIKAQV